MRRPGKCFSLRRKNTAPSCNKLRREVYPQAEPRIPMKTFDFQKAPVVPAHCLWVSGLLLESGCRASAGLPHLQRARQTAGNRPAMGEKASGAWGAPDADPLHGLAAGVVSLWMGCRGECMETSQMRHGSVSVNGREFLLWGGVPHRGVQVREGVCMASRSLDSAQTSDGADVASEKTPSARGRTSTGVGEDPALKMKVIFKPKPEPWAAPDAGGEVSAGKERKPSFCRKVVVFSPAPNPVA